MKVVNILFKKYPFVKKNQKKNHTLVIVINASTISTPHKLSPNLKY